MVGWLVIKESLGAFFHAAVSRLSWQTLLLPALLGLVSHAAPAAGLQPLDEPIAAPALSLADIRGQTHDLAAYRGQVVLVNFWTTTCPPCVHEMPGLQRLARRFGRQEFSLLAVNVGERKYAVHRFQKLIDFDETVLFDTKSETFGRWGGTAFPTSFLIDRSGRVRFMVVGALDWDSDTVVASVQALLEEHSADR